MKLKLFVFLSILVLLPNSAMSRCEYFDLEKSLDKIPYIIHVEVIESDAEGIIYRCAKDKAGKCEHSFTAKVKKVLKGDTVTPLLYFTYDYSVTMPSIKTFHPGEEVVLMINKINEHGHATLHGRFCGRWGTAVDKITDIQKVLGKDN